MSHILREIAILIAYPFCSTARFFSTGMFVVRNQKSPHSVILVGHWLTHNMLHLYMKRMLENQGVRVYMFNYSLIKGDVHKGAEALDKYIKDNHITNAVMVGISMGAVLSYYYLQKYNGWNYTKTFISVGAPLHGTFATYLIPFFPSARLMFPKSDFLKDLHKEPVKNPDRIVCVSAKKDQFVPPSSNVLPKVKSLVLPIIGHNNLHVASQTVCNIILASAKS